MIGFRVWKRWIFVFVIVLIKLSYVVLPSQALENHQIISLVCHGPNLKKVLRSMLSSDYIDIYVADRGYDGMIVYQKKIVYKQFDHSYRFMLGQRRGIAVDKLLQLEMPVIKMMVHHVKTDHVITWESMPLKFNFLDKTLTWPLVIELILE